MRLLEGSLTRSPSPPKGGLVTPADEEQGKNFTAAFTRKGD